MHTAVGVVWIMVKYANVMFLWQHDGSDTPGVIQLLLLPYNLMCYL